MGVINLFEIIKEKAKLVMLVTIMFCITCFGSSKAYALTLPITEDFETANTSGVSAALPNNWSTTTTSGVQWSRKGADDTFATLVTQVSPHESTWMAKADVFAAEKGDSDRLYTTDSFSFPSTGFCEYSFWMFHYPDMNGSDGAADSIQPQISQDGGTTWSNAGTEIKRVNGTTGWTKYTISLSSADYGGQNVKVGLFAYADYGFSMYIDDISIYSTTPTNLTATAGSGQVSLSWNSVTGATGYKVYISTASGSGYSEVDSGTAKTAASYTVTGLNNGTTYYFVVKAITAASGESAYSNEASATPQSTVPSAPDNLTATEGNGQVSLTWDSVAGATSYKVYKSTTTGTGYSEVDPGTAKTATSYTVTGLSNSTWYYFVVTVTTSGGESPYSSEVSAMSSVPSAPTNLSATSGDGQVSLSWDSVIGATGYKVYKSTATGSGYIEVDSGTNKTATSYTVTGLSNNTPYYFVVKASGIEDSSYSNEVCSTPLKAEAPAGAGTLADPYIVDGPYDLVWMSANIVTVKDKYFKQIADIDMIGVVLTPVGSTVDSFTGTYDGCGRNISNLTISSNLTSVGLFGDVSSPGAVKYLTLTNANIKCTNDTAVCQVGGIAGLNSGTIESCNLVGSSFIESAGNSSLGGILGSNQNGTIRNCYSTATITGHSSSSSMGGITGYSSNSSTQTCYFAGTLTGDAATKGGIIGFSYSGNTITDNYFLSTAATNGIGSSASDSGAAPTSDADLKKQATFNSVNWDFSTVWYINENNAYPVLRTPAPYASDITLNLNPVDTNDIVTVSGRTAGDTVNIYAAQTGGVSLFNATVQAGQTSVTVDIGKLTTIGNSIFISITTSLRPEGGRTQKGIPSAPTDITAVAGNTQATVSFSKPASDGGSAITGYTVTSNPGGGTDSNAGSTSLSHVITGLTNGTAYTFTVTATNSVGTGLASDASAAVTPATVPGAPTIGTATAGDGQATVSFSAPASDGGSTITGYTVTSYPADGTDSDAGSTSLSHVITGLINGTAYTFTVTATNSMGTSATSDASAAVTPVGVPGKPTISTVTGGDKQVTVSFSAPASDGGSAITGYMVTSNPADGTDSNAGSTSLSHVITGLTNGTEYTFTVTAMNSEGTGPASDASEPVVCCLVTYRGAQLRTNADTYDIRFLATIDTLDADAVGFVFSKSEPNPTKENVPLQVKSTTTVYESVTAAELTVTARELGGTYIIACTVTGIPASQADTPLYVRAFVTKGTETTYTTVRTITVNGLK